MLQSSGHRSFLAIDVFLPVGHAIPQSSIQHPPVSALLHSAPLLKEEGYTAFKALVADLSHPCNLHGTSAGAGFTANNDPVDAPKR
jgi:hypothetical protein